MAKHNRKNTLHEIAIEAGRRKDTTHKRRHRTRTYDDTPEKEGMRHRWHCTGEYYDKFEQLDKLGALYKWLHSRCGKPFSKVWSELNDNLGQGVAAKHIRDHVNWAIERYPEKINGEYYHTTGRWYGGPRLIREGDFYVDEHGFLRQIPYTPKKKRKEIKDEYTIKTKTGLTETKYYVVDIGHDRLVFTERLEAPKIPYLLNSDAYNQNIGKKYIYRRRYSYDIWKIGTPEINPAKDKWEVVYGPFSTYYGHKLDKKAS